MSTKILSLHDIPMMPEMAIKALSLVKNPETPIRALAAVIERDPSLTTSILRLVNSPYYRTTRTIENLDQAVIRLGMRECQNLIMTVGLRSLMKNIPVSKRQRCEVLWRHSLVAASLCRRLNQLLELGFTGEEFSCGLCHDIGRILITLGAPAYCELADPVDFHEGTGTLPRESQILGIDHCGVGAWFSQLNELPESLAAAIQNHHTPAAAGIHTPLVGLTAAADDMANALLCGDSLADYDLTTRPGGSFFPGLWGEEKTLKLKAEAPAMMEAVAKETEGAMTIGS